MSDRASIINALNHELPRAPKDRLFALVQMIDNDFLLPIAYSQNDKAYSIDSRDIETAQLRKMLEVLRA